jgi:NAD(P)-dependent dehydrogenase (short-subunit alcohol dehydrogenase family)
MSLFDLKGKVALITGAGSGIGQRQSQALARAGASVVLLDRNQELLDSAVAEIEVLDGHAAPLLADLGDREALAGVAQQAANPFGPVDILINAAGVNLRQPVDDITLESWDLTINLNLAVPFFLARELVPAMQAKAWGKIINIASLQSSRAFANSLPYGASKGGVAQLTRAMAETWSSTGISCNAIAPGFFPTRLTASVYQNPEALEKLANQTAIGRNGELPDLDGVTIFLAAAASDYITGQIIHLDGGFTAK